MEDSFLKISIIDGAFSICNQHRLYPENSIDEIIKQLRRGPVSTATYDFERAKQLIELVGWETFIIESSRHEQLQQTLKNLVLIIKPFWARISYLGRTKVKQILTDDELQCLNFAGLLVDNPSDNVINWWETIGKFFRILDDDKKMEIGKEGERRSLELETERLLECGINNKPKWISIEDNTAGFDILSYRNPSPVDISEIKIEVKACTYSPVHFIITKNEWKTALEYKNNYIFHIWNLENNELIEIDVEEMKLHIPTNNGLGKWGNVKIAL